MMLPLHGYDVSVRYRNGKDMTLADTLSRAYLDRPSEQTEIEQINSLVFSSSEKRNLKN